MTTRLATAFTRARSEDRAAFVAYLCAGDPDPATSLDLCRALVRAGVDVLELGMPFSDPLADGPTNQLAAQRALAGGMDTRGCLDLVRALRRESDVPVVFYTYANLVFSPGVETFVRGAREAGVDGLLVLDLPPEEADEVRAAARAAGLDTVFLVAPTSTDARVAKIAAAATGFVYYVSREGVTGVREAVATNIPEAVARIRRYTTLPVAVGFGIARREQVRAVAEAADAVVVGSALVNVVARHAGDAARMVAEMEALGRDLVAGTRRQAPA